MKRLVKHNHQHEKDYLLPLQSHRTGRVLWQREHWGSACHRFYGGTAPSFISDDVNQELGKKTQPVINHTSLAPTYTSNYLKHLPNVLIRGLLSAYFHLRSLVRLRLY